MIQPYDFPERMMSADPDFYIKKKLAKTKQGLSFFGEAALAEYMRCFRNPETVHAMCEDYRATFGIDLEMDNKDFEAGRKITCPVMLLWGATGGVGRNHKSMEDLAASTLPTSRGGKAVPSGHYLAEEARKRPTRSCRNFLPPASCSRNLRLIPWLAARNKLREQVGERELPLGQALFVGIAGNRIDVLYVPFGGAIFPRVAADDLLLLLPGRAIPDERHLAGALHALHGDSLCLVEGIEHVAATHGWLHDLLPDGHEMHDREHAGLAEIGDLLVLEIWK